MHFFSFLQLKLRWPVLKQLKHCLSLNFGTTLNLLLQIPKLKPFSRRSLYFSVPVTSALTIDVGWFSNLEFCLVDLEMPCSLSILFTESILSVFGRPKSETLNILFSLPKQGVVPFEKASAGQVLERIL